MAEPRCCLSRYGITMNFHVNKFVEGKRRQQDRRLIEFASKNRRVAAQQRC